MANPTKPSAPRVQKLRDQRREQGLVRLEFWVPADNKAEIKALVDAFLTNKLPVDTAGHTTNLSKRQ